mgnify:CR=1 FL=1
MRDSPVTGVQTCALRIWQWDGEKRDDPPFPLLALIASGGHTDLVLMSDFGSYQLLGRTRDDAAGEAFDKSARVLGLGFPGGPIIEKTARETTNPAKLPRPWLRGSHDFSFSGLKTAVLRMAEAEGEIIPEHRIAEIAAGFQESVVEVLVGKTVAAADYNYKYRKKDFCTSLFFFFTYCVSYLRPHAVRGCRLQWEPRLGK